MVERLLLIGSASVHTWRYLAGIAPHVGRIYLVCNTDVPPERRPANLAGTLTVDFGLKALRTAGRIRDWARRIEPDMVHVHQANSVAWHAVRALQGCPAPLVLSAWGSDVLLLPRQNALMRRMVSTNLAAASVVTSDSLHMAAVIRELAGEGPAIKVLNFGMDALPPEPDFVSRPRRVLSCRLHKPLYRIDAILRAWRDVENDNRFADWSLTVAASGEETDSLKALAASLTLQRVSFTGFVKTDVLAGLYRDSRVFVSVPSSDATSISLLEAMGHGCLPVLSNLPANGEWVIDGLNGKIVEDIATLSVPLREAMLMAEDGNALERIAAINRNLVAAKALHEPNMRRFAEIYASLQSRSE
ncbi:glycosyltransferase family 4 protein [Paludibacterium paludis]|uniref:Capsular polysaccharide biosynthesis protein n=1 Tax=Paludibacterium paludis TaxID=1225769 RepID=A0A918UAT5_9NEIS|nr:glycosyltransferase family 4 protein [Paludibacterium paludis]GGY18582.1 capsular polysaccharide biosynthesis protein [Paludibacterium paludis]